MSWQKIERLAEVSEAQASTPMNSWSAIFTNQLMMFQTQKKSPLSIKIWWYLMTSCFRNKTSVKPITFVEGIQIVIACIWAKITSSFPARQFEKMQISFVCFRKIRKILTTFLTTTCLKPWRKNSSKKLCKTAWAKPHNFVVIDLTSPKNSGKYRSGFDNFYIIE